MTTNYVWDPSAGSGQAVAAGLPVVLQDGTNTNVYGLDLLSATDSSGVQSYFLYDGLGSTVGLTNSSGNQSAKYTYDAFGSVHTHTGVPAATTPAGRRESTSCPAGRRRGPGRPA